MNDQEKYPFDKKEDSRINLNEVKQNAKKLLSLNSILERVNIHITLREIKICILAIKNILTKQKNIHWYNFLLDNNYDEINEESSNTEFYLTTNKFIILFLLGLVNINNDLERKLFVDSFISKALYKYTILNNEENENDNYEGSDSNKSEEDLFLSKFNVLLLLLSCFRDFTYTMKKLSLNNQLQDITMNTNIFNNIRPEQEDSFNFKEIDNETLIYKNESYLDYGFNCLSINFNHFFTFLEKITEIYSEGVFNSSIENKEIVKNKNTSILEANKSLEKESNDISINEDNIYISNKDKEFNDNGLKYSCNHVTLLNHTLSEKNKLTLNSFKLDYLSDQIKRMNKQLSNIINTLKFFILHFNSHCCNKAEIQKNKCFLELIVKLVYNQEIVIKFLLFINHSINAINDFLRKDQYHKPKTIIDIKNSQIIYSIFLKTFNITEKWYVIELLLKNIINEVFIQTNLSTDFFAYIVDKECKTTQKVFSSILGNKKYITKNDLVFVDIEKLLSSSLMNRTNSNDIDYNINNDKHTDRNKHFKTCCCEESSNIKLIKEEYKKLKLSNISIIINITTMHKIYFLSKLVTSFSLFSTTETIRLKQLTQINIEKFNNFSLNLKTKKASYNSQDFAENSEDETLDCIDINDKKASENNLKSENKKLCDFICLSQKHKANKQSKHKLSNFKTKGLSPVKNKTEKRVVNKSPSSNIFSLVSDKLNINSFNKENKNSKNIISSDVYSYSYLSQYSSFFSDFDIELIRKFKLFNQLCLNLEHISESFYFNPYYPNYSFLKKDICSNYINRETLENEKVMYEAFIELNRDSSYEYNIYGEQCHSDSGYNSIRFPKKGYSFIISFNLQDIKQENLWLSSPNNFENSNRNKNVIKALNCENITLENDKYDTKNNTKHNKNKVINKNNKYTIITILKGQGKKIKNILTFKIVNNELIIKCLETTINTSLYVVTGVNYTLNIVHQPNNKIIIKLNNSSINKELNYPDVGECRCVIGASISNTPSKNNFKSSMLEMNSSLKKSNNGLNALNRLNKNLNFSNSFNPQHTNTDNIEHYFDFFRGELGEIMMFSFTFSENIIDIVSSISLDSLGILITNYCEDQLNNLTNATENDSNEYLSNNYYKNSIINIEETLFNSCKYNINIDESKYEDMIKELKAMIKSKIFINNLNLIISPKAIRRELFSNYYSSSSSFFYSEYIPLNNNFNSSSLLFENNTNPPNIPNIGNNKLVDNLEITYSFKEDFSDFYNTSNSDNSLFSYDTSVIALKEYNSKRFCIIYPFLNVDFKELDIPSNLKDIFEEYEIFSSKLKPLELLKFPPYRDSIFYKKSSGSLDFERNSNNDNKKYNSTDYNHSHNKKSSGFVSNLSFLKINYKSNNAWKTVNNKLVNEFNSSYNAIRLLTYFIDYDNELNNLDIDLSILECFRYKLLFKNSANNKNSLKEEAMDVFKSKKIQKKLLNSFIYLTNQKTSINEFLISIQDSNSNSNASNNKELKLFDHLILNNDLSNNSNNNQTNSANTKKNNDELFARNKNKNFNKIVLKSSEEIFEISSLVLKLTENNIFYMVNSPKYLTSNNIFSNIRHKKENKSVLTKQEIKDFLTTLNYFNFDLIEEFICFCYKLIRYYYLISSFFFCRNLVKSEIKADKKIQKELKRSGDNRNNRYSKNSNNNQNKRAINRNKSSQCLNAFRTYSEKLMNKKDINYKVFFTNDLLLKNLEIFQFIETIIKELNFISNIGLFNKESLLYNSNSESKGKFSFEQEMHVKINSLLKNIYFLRSEFFSVFFINNLYFKNSFFNKFDKQLAKIFGSSVKGNSNGNQCKDYKPSDISFCSNLIKNTILTKINYLEYSLFNCKIIFEVVICLYSSFISDNTLLVTPKLFCSVFSILNLFILSRKRLKRKIEYLIDINNNTINVNKGESTDNKELNDSLYSNIDIFKNYYYKTLNQILELIKEYIIIALNTKNLTLVNMLLNMIWFNKLNYCFTYKILQLLYYLPSLNKVKDIISENYLVIFFLDLIKYYTNNISNCRADSDTNKEQNSISYNEFTQEEIVYYQQMSVSFSIRFIDSIYFKNKAAINFVSMWDRKNIGLSNTPNKTKNTFNNTSSMISNLNAVKPKQKDSSRNVLTNDKLKKINEKNVSGNTNVNKIFTHKHIKKQIRSNNLIKEFLDDNLIDIEDSNNEESDSHSDNNYDVNIVIKDKGDNDASVNRNSSSLFSSNKSYNSSRSNNNISKINDQASYFNRSNSIDNLQVSNFNNENNETQNINKPKHNDNLAIERKSLSCSNKSKKNNLKINNNLRVSIPYYDKNNFNRNYAYSSSHKNKNILKEPNKTNFLSNKKLEYTLNSNKNIKQASCSETKSRNSKHNRKSSNSRNSSNSFSKLSKKKLKVACNKQFHTSTNLLSMQESFTNQMNKFNNENSQNDYLIDQDMRKVNNYITQTNNNTRKGTKMKMSSKIFSKENYNFVQKITQKSLKLTNNYNYQRKSEKEIFKNNYFRKSKRISKLSTKHKSKAFKALPQRTSLLLKSTPKKKQNPNRNKSTTNTNYFNTRVSYRTIKSKNNKNNYNSNHLKTKQDLFAELLFLMLLTENIYGIKSLILCCFQVKVNYYLKDKNSDITNDLMNLINNAKSEKKLVELNYIKNKSSFIEFLNQTNKYQNIGKNNIGNKNYISNKLQLYKESKSFISNFIRVIELNYIGMFDDSEYQSNLVSLIESSLFKTNMKFSFSSSIHAKTSKLNTNSINNNKDISFDNESKVRFCVDFILSVFEMYSYFVIVYKEFSKFIYSSSGFYNNNENKALELNTSSIENNSIPNTENSLFDFHCNKMISKYISYKKTYSNFNSNDNDTNDITDSNDSSSSSKPIKKRSKTAFKSGTLTNRSTLKNKNRSINNNKASSTSKPRQNKYKLTKKINNVEFINSSEEGNDIIENNTNITIKRNTNKREISHINVNFNNVNSTNISQTNTTYNVLRANSKLNIKNNNNNMNKSSNLNNNESTITTDFINNNLTKETLSSISGLDLTQGNHIEEIVSHLSLFLRLFFFLYNKNKVSKIDKKEDKIISSNENANNNTKVNINANSLDYSKEQCFNNKDTIITKDKQYKNKYNYVNLIHNIKFSSVVDKINSINLIMETSLYESYLNFHFANNKKSFIFNLIMSFFVTKKLNDDKLIEMLELLLFPIQNHFSKALQQAQDNINSNNQKDSNIKNKMQRDWQKCVEKKEISMETLKSYNLENITYLILLKNLTILFYQISHLTYYNMLHSNKEYTDGRRPIEIANNYNNNVNNIDNLNNNVRKTNNLISYKDEYKFEVKNKNNREKFNEPLEKAGISITAENNKKRRKSTISFSSMSESDAIYITKKGSFRKSSVKIFKDYKPKDDLTLKNSNDNDNANASKLNTGYLTGRNPIDDYLKDNKNKSNLNNTNDPNNITDSISTFENNNSKILKISNKTISSMKSKCLTNNDKSLLCNSRTNNNVQSKFNITRSNSYKNDNNKEQISKSRSKSLNSISNSYRKNTTTTNKTIQSSKKIENHNYAKYTLVEHPLFISLFSNLINLLFNKGLVYLGSKKFHITEERSNTDESFYKTILEMVFEASIVMFKYSGNIFYLELLTQNLELKRPNLVAKSTNLLQMDFLRDYHVSLLVKELNNIDYLKNEAKGLFGNKDFCGIIRKGLNSNTNNNNIHYHQNFSSNKNHLDNTQKNNNINITNSNNNINIINSQSKTINANLKDHVMKIMKTTNFKSEFFEDVYEMQHYFNDGYTISNNYYLVESLLSLVTNELMEWRTLREELTETKFEKVNKKEVDNNEIREVKSYNDNLIINNTKLNSEFMFVNKNLFKHETTSNVNNISNTNNINSINIKDKTIKVIDTSALTQKINNLKFYDSFLSRLKLYLVNDMTEHFRIEFLNQLYSYQSDSSNTKKTDNKGNKDQQGPILDFEDKVKSSKEKAVETHFSRSNFNINNPYIKNLRKMFVTRFTSLYTEYHSKRNLNKELYSTKEKFLCSHISNSFININFLSEYYNLKLELMNKIRRDSSDYFNLNIGDKKKKSSNKDGLYNIISKKAIEHIQITESNYLNQKSMFVAHFNRGYFINKLEIKGICLDVYSCIKNTRGDNKTNKNIDKRLSIKSLRPNTNTINVDKNKYNFNLLDEFNKVDNAKVNDNEAFSKVVIDSNLHNKPVDTNKDKLKFLPSIDNEIVTRKYLRNLTEKTETKKIVSLNPPFIDPINQIKTVNANTRSVNKLKTFNYPINSALIPKLFQNKYPNNRMNTDDLIMKKAISEENVNRNNSSTSLNQNRLNSGLLGYNRNKKSMKHKLNLSFISEKSYNRESYQSNRLNTITKKETNNSNKELLKYRQSLFQNNKIKSSKVSFHESTSLVNYDSDASSFSSEKRINVDSNKISDKRELNKNSKTCSYLRAKSFRDSLLSENSSDKMLNTKEANSFNKVEIKDDYYNFFNEKIIEKHEYLYNKKRSNSSRVSDIRNFNSNNNEKANRMSIENEPKYFNYNNEFDEVYTNKLENDEMINENDTYFKKNNNSQIDDFDSSNNKISLSQKNLFFTESLPKKLNESIEIKSNNDNNKNNSKINLHNNDVDLNISNNDNFYKKSKRTKDKIKLYYYETNYTKDEELKDYFIEKGRYFITKKEDLSKLQLEALTYVIPKIKFEKSIMETNFNCFNKLDYSSNNEYSFYSGNRVIENMRNEEANDAYLILNILYTNKIIDVEDNKLKKKQLKAVVKKNTESKEEINNDYYEREVNLNEPINNYDNKLDTLFGNDEENRVYEVNFKCRSSTPSIEIENKNIDIDDEVKVCYSKLNLDQLEIMKPHRVGKLSNQIRTLTNVNKDNASYKNTLTTKDSLNNIINTRETIHHLTSNNVVPKSFDVLVKENNKFKNSFLSQFSLKQKTIFIDSNSKYDSTFNFDYARNKNTASNQLSNNRSTKTKTLLQYQYPSTIKIYDINEFDKLEYSHSYLFEYIKNINNSTRNESLFNKLINDYQFGVSFEKKCIELKLGVCFSFENNTYLKNLNISRNKNSINKIYNSICERNKIKASNDKANKINIRNNNDNLHRVGLVNNNYYFKERKQDELKINTISVNQKDNNGIISDRMVKLVEKPTSLSISNKNTSSPFKSNNINKVTATPIKEAKEHISIFDSEYSSQSDSKEEIIYKRNRIATESKIKTEKKKKLSLNNNNEPIYIKEQSQRSINKEQLVLVRTKSKSTDGQFNINIRQYMNKMSKEVNKNSKSNNINTNTNHYSNTNTNFNNQVTNDAMIKTILPRLGNLKNNNTILNNAKKSTLKKQKNPIIKKLSFNSKDSDANTSDHEINKGVKNKTVSFNFIAIQSLKSNEGVLNPNIISNKDITKHDKKVSINEPHKQTQKHQRLHNQLHKRNKSLYSQDNDNYNRTKKQISKMKKLKSHFTRDFQGSLNISIYESFIISETVSNSVLNNILNSNIEDFLYSSLNIKPRQNENSKDKNDNVKTDVNYNLGSFNKNFFHEFYKLNNTSASKKTRIKKIVNVFSAEIITLKGVYNTKLSLFNFSLLRKTLTDVLKEYNNQIKDKDKKNNADVQENFIENILFLYDSLLMSKLDCFNFSFLDKDSFLNTKKLFNAKTKTNSNTNIPSSGFDFSSINPNLFYLKSSIKEESSCKSFSSQNFSFLIELIKTNISIDKALDNILCQNTDNYSRNGEVSTNASQSEGFINTQQEKIFMMNNLLNNNNISYSVLANNTSSLVNNSNNNYNSCFIFFNEITQIIIRRFALKWQAVEIFYISGDSLFLNLFDETNCNNLISFVKDTIRNGEYDILILETKTSIINYFERTNYTDMWLESKLSNYDYMSIINKFSGRSFKDANQYYVFPWVVTSFETKELFPNMRCSLEAKTDTGVRMKNNKKNKDCNEDKESNDNKHRSTSNTKVMSKFSSPSVIKIIEKIEEGKSKTFDQQTTPKNIYLEDKRIFNDIYLNKEDDNSIKKIDILNTSNNNEKRNSSITKDVIILDNKFKSNSVNEEKMIKKKSSKDKDCIIIPNNIREEYSKYGNNNNDIDNNKNNDSQPKSSLLRNFKYPIVCQTENQRERIIEKYMEISSIYNEYSLSYTEEKEKSNNKENSYINIFNKSKEKETNNNNNKDIIRFKMKSQLHTIYSNSSFVNYYNLRLYPFAEMNIKLQNGHFDVANRLFSSVPETLKIVYNFDNRELVPEVFTLPDIFSNNNFYYFGEKFIDTNCKETSVVNNVSLPYWAETNNSHKFSHYYLDFFNHDNEIKSQLNEFIDLIFGVDQKNNELCGVCPLISYEEDEESQYIFNKIKSKIMKFKEKLSCLINELTNYSDNLDNFNLNNNNYNGSNFNNTNTNSVYNNNINNSTLNNNTNYNLYNNTSKASYLISKKANYLDSSFNLNNNKAIMTNVNNINIRFNNTINQSNKIFNAVASYFNKDNSKFMNSNMNNEYVDYLKDSYKDIKELIITFKTNICTIINFGQVPMKLFSNKHIKKELTISANSIQKHNNTKKVDVKLNNNNNTNIKKVQFDTKTKIITSNSKEKIRESKFNRINSSLFNTKRVSNHIYKSSLLNTEDVNNKKNRLLFNQQGSTKMFKIMSYDKYYLLFKNKKEKLGGHYLNTDIRYFNSSLNYFYLLNSRNQILVYNKSNLKNEIAVFGLKYSQKQKRLNYLDHAFPAYSYSNIFSELFECEVFLTCAHLDNTIKIYYSASLEKFNQNNNNESNSNTNQYDYSISNESVRVDKDSKEDKESKEKDIETNNQNNKEKKLSETQNLDNNLNNNKLHEKNKNELTINTQMTSNLVPNKNNLKLKHNYISSNYFIGEFVVNMKVLDISNSKVDTEFPKTGNERKLSKNNSGANTNTHANSNENYRRNSILNTDKFFNIKRNYLSKQIKEKKEVKEKHKIVLLALSTNVIEVRVLVKYENTNNNGINNTDIYGICNSRDIPISILLIKKIFVDFKYSIYSNINNLVDKEFSNYCLNNNNYYMIYKSNKQIKSINYFKEENLIAIHSEHFIELLDSLTYSLIVTVNIEDLVLHDYNIDINDNRKVSSIKKTNILNNIILKIQLINNNLLISLFNLETEKFSYVLISTKGVVLKKLIDQSNLIFSSFDQFLFGVNVITGSLSIRKTFDIDEVSYYINKHCIYYLYEFL